MAERHPLSWAAIAVAAAAAAVACFLPAFELAIEAIIGADEEQEAFRYTSELTLVSDLRPLGLVPLAAALVIGALAVLALVRGAARWLVVVAFVLAWCLVLLVLDVDGRLDWPGDSGVIGYEEPHAGPLLGPGLDDLRAAAARSPEAQRPGWDPGDPYAYASRGLGGWQLFTWAALVLAWLTGYRLARLRYGVRASVLIVAGATVAGAVVLFVRGLSGLE